MRKTSWSRVGSVPTLMAELSWNSRLWRLLKMGAYWKFFLKNAHFSLPMAKYRCVSLLRLVTVRTYRIRTVVNLQMASTTEMEPRMMNRYCVIISFTLVASGSLGVPPPPPVVPFVVGPAMSSRRRCLVGKS